MVAFHKIIKTWVIIFLRLDFILPDVSRGMEFCKKNILMEFCKKNILNPFTSDSHFRFSGKVLLTSHIGVIPFPKPSYACDHEREPSVSPKGCYSGLWSFNVPEISSNKHSFSPKVITGQIWY
jgi:hypothetical protein